MKNILALFLFFSVLQGFSQRFSTNPDEFIGQLDKSLREARQEKFAEQFRSTWMRGTFTATQQEKIIALTQKIIAKKGLIGREVKRFLEALENALETQSLSSTQLDNLLVVSEQFFATANAGQILTFAERLNSLFLYKALYLSNYNKIYVDGSYEIIFSDSLTRSKHSWFKGWKEGESEPDSLGNVQPYPHPLVAGASIVFPKTNLYLVTPEDSVSINDTKIALVLEKDYLVGDKGRFSWQSLYNRGEVDSVALGGGISRKDIYVDLERYSHRLSNQIFKTGQATLVYPSKIKDPVKGVFEFASEKRKNIKDLKYPLFKSYEEKSEVFNIGKDISYTGGIKVQGFKLYGYSPKQRPNGRLFVKKGGEVKFHANSKEFYLGEDKIYAKSASFGYYISGADSLTHIDVTLSYNRTQIQGDSTPANIFKLYKDKKNDDIPFIDEYHKMYITADLALYNPEKDLVDFYILGASEKVPAIFESFSYFDEERYNEIQGGYDFQPLQLVQFYADKYGYANSQGDKEFNLFAVLEEQEEENKKVRKKNRNQPVATPGAVKSAINRLAREGYVNFDPYEGRVVILNRTTQNVNSYFYKKAMDFVEKNPKRKIPANLAPYAEKDFDDMLIESISPRDARKDSVLKDTIRFSFNGGRILYPKLENKNIFITKRVFVSKPDTTASVGLDGEDIKARRDTTITLTDTFKIDRFLTSQKVLLSQDLELFRLDPNQFTLMELEGYFSTGARKKGPAMPNASLIEGGGIIIRGIERFAISKKLNLNFIPKNKEIRIFGDRVINMEEGEVTVGNFRFIGKNFVLPYDEFKLTMGEIDTVLFAVQDPKNPNLKYELGGEIKMNAGDLLINHPNNKSGLKKGQIPGWKKGEVYEAYPKLSIETGGKIYFDAFYRERFAYHKSQVYFEIPKIELDSLNSKMPKFSGTFYSNIFPPIKEELVAIYDPKYNGVESKYALGFVHRPKKPLKLYHTKAELKADSIVMYKTGLVASGKNLELKNHTYTLKTSELVLTPDSVHTKNANILVKQGKMGNAFYPEALGENLKLSWYTTKLAGKDTLKLDSLTLRNKPKDYIRLFDAKNPASLSGTMAITPEALWAIGKITRKDFFLFAPQGATISPDRIFTPDLPDNIVEFKVHSTDLDPFNVEYGTDYKHLIDANAVFVDFDLKNSICKISHNPFISKQNAQYEFFSFPYAQFKTSIKEATWDVKKKEITMKGDDNSIFHSTKFEEEEQAPNKDLYFKATAGKYDIKDLNTPILELEGVPYITSADARIIPDKGKVTVLKGADVQTLHNSTVVVDTLNSYHTLVNGHIKINNREDFEGDATYRYVNVVKDTAKIKFDRFELVGSEAVSEAGKVKRTRVRKRAKNEDTLQIPSRYTQSRGEVLETDNFFITSRIKFKGTAEMLAYKKDLILDGFIQLVLKSRKDGDFWIPYQRDAGDVLIEVEEKMEAQGDVVTSGLHYTYEENGKLYTTFLSGKKGDEDADMHLAKGVLTYSPELNEFKITDKAKLEKDSYEGSLLTLDDGKGTMEMQGKFNFFDENTKKLISAAGTTKVDLKKNHYEFNQFFAIDFSKFKSVLSGIADMFKFAKMDGGGEQAYNTDDASLMNRLAEIIGDSKAKKYENQARGKYIPLVNADKKILGKGLVISSVNLVWSDTTNSFYSVGKIGLANILAKDVNAQIDGFMEIQKQEDGDVLNLYLEASPELWIFLSFSQNTLSGESSVEKVNNQFSKGKKAKKVGDLSMELAEDGAAEHFKARFKQYYTDKNFGEVKRVAKKVEEKEEPEEEPEKKSKKSKKKKKKTDEDEDDVEPAEEKKEEIKKEEPKKEEKPKEEKKSKKKKKTDEDEDDVEPAEEKKEEIKKEEPKKEEKPKEEKKEEPKKEEKPKEEKKKEEKKPKTEKPEKPKKEKKKKKGEEEEEEEPEEETPKKKDKKKDDDKDGF